MAVTQVSITAISGSGSLVTYTAVNTFTAGQKIIVFGATTAGYNSSITEPNIGFIISTATSSQFTVVSTATGTGSTATAEPYVLVADVNDITEEFQVDLSRTSAKVAFSPTDSAYDLSIDELPFIMRISNQYPYRRETAPYKKDQFDSSGEPGEQSLTGWWLRSQTSWHNGAGLKYFEPGTDKNVTHRFKDSRGINVWDIGDAKLLKDTFQLYHNTGVGKIVAVSANDGTYDCLVSGDNAGVLKKVRFNTVYPDADVSTNGTYTTTYTLATSHTSAHDFLSITTDGTHYYAACERAIHKGNIGGTTSDVVIFEYPASTLGKTIVKYAKNYLLMGQDAAIYQLDPTLIVSGTTHNKSTVSSTATSSRTHSNSGWTWNSIIGGQNVIYASGYAGSTSEIWKIPYNPTNTNIDLTAMTVVATLPFGEIVKSMGFYLNYLLIGTNKGVRVANVDVDGNIVYGPLLYVSTIDVNGFVFSDNYAWAATTLSNGPEHAGLIRIDLGSPFADGTFPYAADLEYESDVASEATGVFRIDNRLLIVSEEGGNGEINAESYTNYRTYGWIETGYIRFATVEPKFFKYVNVNADIGAGDSIQVQTIDHSGNEYDINMIDGSTVGTDISLNYPAGSQEFIGLRFTLTNGSPITTIPILQSYQVKALPASKRQRLIQYPLSCFDVEMDRFNSQFGYRGRAYEVLESLENLEANGDFVLITDYRTGEVFNGIIEEVRFTNESSPDKDNSGHGGIVVVTVRKIS